MEMSIHNIKSIKLEKIYSLISEGSTEFTHSMSIKIETDNTYDEEIILFTDDKKVLEGLSNE